MKPNENTRQVNIGGHAGAPHTRTVLLGGGAPVVVQSMLNAPARDVEANLAQIRALAAAGCEVVRMAIPARDCLDAFEAVCAQSPLPVVADIHFDAQIAIEAARRGAAKLRINPGNIGGLEKTDEVIEAAREAGIPIRIGVNAGSLDAARRPRTQPSRDFESSRSESTPRSQNPTNSGHEDDAGEIYEDLSLPEKLAASAAEYVAHFESRGFHDIVVSAKAHDVRATIATYRLLAERIPHVPLHIGVTEAGTTFQGIIKSACGLGVLLEQGIGDTLRISLTDDPVTEIRACWALLGALDLRHRGPEIISCPTCGRCQVDLIGLARQVEERLASVEKPLKVAVMGCVVNGPGEAADADIGVACGAGSGALFSRGRIVRKVSEGDIVDALMEEIAHWE